MSMLNQFATMTIKVHVGNAYKTKLLKDTVLFNYAYNVIFKKSFTKIGEECKLSLSSKKLQRVHSDSKSKFGGAHCMSIGYERAPSADGGGYYRVIGLYTGDEPVKDNLIVKAEFGDKIPETEKPESHVVTGFMFRTVFLMVLKVQISVFLGYVCAQQVQQLLNVQGVQDIDVHKVPVDPEA
ncbi:hypothetical protein J132_09996 [Termitomyces sp. J132]|nr:hypothetical protein H2248_008014 [Termitomyces sp. 'cryptogamus']KNZ76524.1 hypothetical protein J132_09996 [Termitomyces sp. J132]